MCSSCVVIIEFFCFKQKTAYEMRISDWSSDVCSSDLANDVDAFAARIKFNMPMFTPHESAIMRTHENPFEVLLYSFKDGDEVRAMGYDGVKKAVKEAGEIQGLTEDISRNFEEMVGKSFDFLMDRDGKDRKSTRLNFSH